MITALHIAGVIQLAILVAVVELPRRLGWRRTLDGLDPLTRQLVWTHLGFIGYAIAGFGTVSLAAAGELASGTALARAVCGLMALFWIARLVIGLGVLRVGPLLTDAWSRGSYGLLTACVAYLAGVYTWGALS